MLVTVPLKTSPAVSAAEFTSRPDGASGLLMRLNIVVATEVYHVDSTTNICVSIMCRQLYAWN
jgi:hypothetical protein